MESIKYKISLQTVLIAQSIILSLVVVCTIGFFAYRITANLIENKIERELSVTVRNAMYNIDKEIAERKHNVINWSSDPYIIKLLSDKRYNKLSKYLYKIGKNYLMYNAFIILSKNGDVLSSSDPSLYNNIITFTDYAVKNDVCINNPNILNKEFNIGELAFCDLVQTQSLIFSKIIRDKKEESKGIFVAFYDWIYLYNTIDLIKINSQEQNSDGYINLVNKNGLLILSPIFQRKYGLVGSLNLIKTLSVNSNRKFENLKPGEIAVVKEVIDNKNFLISMIRSAGVLDFVSQDWRLLMFLNKDFAYQSLAKLKMLFIFLSFLVILFGAFLSMLGARRISDPLNFLGALADSISKKYSSGFKLQKNAIDKYLAEFSHIDTVMREPSILSISFHKMLNSIKLYQKEAKSNAQLAAIGQTTQLLAHDVRKPFTALKALLDMFDMFKNNASVLAKAKKEIDAAIVNVESMLNDIMDFSRGEKVDHSPSSLIKIIDFSIRQTSQSFQQKDISFNYYLNHTNKLFVDDERIARVFNNIISNGIEAITIIGKKDKGTISFTSKNILHEERNFIEIRITNDGPPFNTEDLTKVFESFFTKGKKRGTGLGLASAKKIVELHGGTIQARNLKQQKGVEYIITIPSSKEQEGRESITDLPNHIKDTHEKILKTEKTEIGELLHLLTVKNQKVKILLLEDEALYRASVKNVINKNQDLSNILTLYDAETVDDALNLVENEDITSAIVDIDLNHEKNGFEFMEEIQKKSLNIKCMMHSNRMFEKYKRKAKDLGAKMFVPKPLKLEHLVLFLLDKG